ncbi:MAG: holo-ACP synthase [Gammaproteobacteria bacterium]|jgi:holo-[acyl-carrier protein] synthase|nr:holo-ACP synthase [Gammaproteobacteria bacterium]MBQ09169.1 holo-ACP synthase [Gammaproteobacteria bacterium]MDP6146770.1 holo-ACP synthase [Gammaproteobacteria bacterium]HJL79995.1 holo-ACP synthase [Gammaproteobacteria bacterium]HJM09021.1 holo-ACP synthase [Gammaproteobacteria bacterium]|tara:strand:- start:882 stop:1262 length:381 start_codon:yes stop_codon:yes gene_type:complete
MSIYGIGVDLVNANRIQALHEKYGDRFAQRILDDDEMTLFEEAENKERYLCNAFAGKEAAVKALGTGFSEGVHWKDFGLSRKTSGKPELHYTNKIRQKFYALGISSSHISISDDHPWSIAMVVLET